MLIKKKSPAVSLYTRLHKMHADSDEKKIQNNSYANKTGMQKTDMMTDRMHKTIMPILIYY